MLTPLGPQQPNFKEKQPLVEGDQDQKPTGYDRKKDIRPFVPKALPTNIPTPEKKIEPVQAKKIPEPVINLMVKQPSFGSEISEEERPSTMKLSPVGRPKEFDRWAGKKAVPFSEPVQPTEPQPNQESGKITANNQKPLLRQSMEEPIQQGNLKDESFISNSDPQDDEYENELNQIDNPLHTKSTAPDQPAPVKQSVDNSGQINGLIPNMLPQETKSTPGNSQPSFTSAPKIPVSLGTPVMSTPVAPVPKKAAENTLNNPEDPQSKKSAPEVSKITELPAQLPKQVPITDLQKKIEPVIKTNPTAQNTPPVFPTINGQMEAQKEQKVPTQNQKSMPENVAISDEKSGSLQHKQNEPAKFAPQPQTKLPEPIAQTQIPVLIPQPDVQKPNNSNNQQIETPKITQPSETDEKSLFNETQGSNFRPQDQSINSYKSVPNDKQGSQNSKRFPRIQDTPTIEKNPFIAQAKQSIPEDAIDDLMNSNIMGPSILKDKPKSSNSIFNPDSLSNPGVSSPNTKRPNLTNAANTALTSNFSSTPHNQLNNNDTSLNSGYKDDSSILKKDRYKRKPRTDNILNKVPTFNPQDDGDVSKLLSKYNFE